MTVAPVQSETLISPIEDHGSGVAHVSAELFLPELHHLADQPVLVVCVPGGGMTRRYFDLAVEGAYSMARHLASAGLAVVTLDPPGADGSEPILDGYHLTPSAVAAAHHEAIQFVLDHFGRLLRSAGVNASPTVVGLGHSAGGLLVALQQAQHGTFDAVVLLGFHNRGLPEFLSPEELSYADDPAGLRGALPELVAARFGESLPPSPGANPELLGHGELAPEIRDALLDASGRLLGLVGMTAIVPGSIRDELDSIDVPVFLGFGQFDLNCNRTVLATLTPASHDVTIFELEGSGHLHNVARTRIRLWDRIALWIADIHEMAVKERHP